MSIVNLEKLIEDSGIKQKKLIEELKVSNKTWQNRRENPTTITADEILTLSRILNVKPTYLLQVILQDHNA